MAVKAVHPAIVVHCGHQLYSVTEWKEAQSKGFDMLLGLMEENHKLFMHKNFPI